MLRNDYGISVNYGLLKKYGVLIIDFSFGTGVRISDYIETVYKAAPYYDHS